MSGSIDINSENRPNQVGTFLTKPTCGGCEKYHRRDCPSEDKDNIRNRIYDRDSGDTPLTDNCFKERINQTGQVSNEEVARTSFIEDNGKLIEEVLVEGDPKFAVWDGSSVTYVDEYTKGDTHYKPIINTLISDKEIKLPSGVEQFSSIKELLNEIKQHIHKYVDMLPEMETISSWYILMTWHYDKFNSIPYIRFLGDLGTGKSRRIDVIGGLCYKTCIVSGAVTPAPVYRLIQQWKPTLVIDESDWKYSNEYAEIVKILNCGFERGRPIIRCNVDKQNEVQTFDTFGPKILSSKHEFGDPALESRCITEITHVTTREDIPIHLYDDFEKEQQNLRNKLLYYRFAYHDFVVLNNPPSNTMDDLEPRLKQILLCFMDLFQNDPEIIAEVISFAKVYQHELIAKRQDSTEGIIVRAIFDLKDKIAADQSYLTSSKISQHINDEFNLYFHPIAIGKALSSLNVHVKAIKVQGKTVKAITLTDPYMKTLFSRYIPNEVTDSTEVTVDKGDIDKKE